MFRGYEMNSGNPPEIYLLQKITRAVSCLASHPHSPAIHVSSLLPYVVTIYPWEWQFTCTPSNPVEPPRKNKHTCVRERPLKLILFS